MERRRHRRVASVTTDQHVNPDNRYCEFDRLHLLKRWDAFIRFLDDGRICLSNNAAERSIRGIAVGRKNWTFAGSDSGGRRAAAIYTLIETAKLNGVDARAWLADVLARIADHPASRIDGLLPWNWKAA